MTYQELFETLKEKFSKIDFSKVKGHCAFQFDIIGEGEGAFYLEITDGTAIAEPYEYYDRDAKLTATADTLLAIAEGKLAAVAAFTVGRLRVDGDLTKAMELGDLINAAAEKAEKEAAEKPAKAPAEAEKAVEVKIEEKPAETVAAAISKVPEVLAEIKEEIKEIKKTTVKKNNKKKK